jgi:lysophospholipase L1-like esterase
VRRTLPRRRGTITAVLVVALGLLGGVGTAAGPAGAVTAAAATVGDGSPTDTNISYVGRWDTTSPSAAVANWAGAYLLTRFTGTRVSVKAGSTVNLYASIDGGADVFFTGKGTISLTPAALAAGTHTLRIAYRSGDTRFLGLVLDSGARTAPTTANSTLVEFVGDSITAGYLDSKLALSAYGWVVGERLGVRHTQIARAGYCLVAQTGCVGESTQYFRLSSDPAVTTGWDFSRYQAAAVVINLGTNDAGHGVTSATFQAAYTQLMKDIRAEYPNATIFAFETLKMRYVAETKAAVAARKAAGDGKVAFITTEGWLTVNTSDYADGSGHPSDSGHVKIADHLAPILAPALGVAA